MKSEKQTQRARRILIVDDHPVVRHGLVQLLSQMPDLEICGFAAGVREALRQVESLSPDLILVDISLQEGNGIDLIKSVRAQFPEVRMLVTSMHDEALFAGRALNAGAMGYVNKNEPAERLIEAVQVVLGGDVYMSPAVASRLIHVKRSGERKVIDSPLAELSDRELEVFEAIGRGESTRAIASQLSLSVKTIEAHRENIKRKLSLANNTELIQRSFRWVLEKQ